MKTYGVLNIQTSDHGPPPTGGSGVIPPHVVVQMARRHGKSSAAKQALQALIDHIRSGK